MHFSIAVCKAGFMGRSNQQLPRIPTYKGHINFYSHKNKSLKNIGLKGHQIISLPGLHTCVGYMHVTNFVCIKEEFSDRIFGNLMMRIEINKYFDLVVQVNFYFG
jgi:hypothetical protein